MYFSIPLKYKFLRFAEPSLTVFMEVGLRTVQNWLKQSFLSMPILLKLSELLQEDLVALYHPNVPPKPDPRDAEIADLKKERAECKEKIAELENDNGILKNRNIKLEGQLELAMQEINEFMRRKAG